MFKTGAPEVERLGRRSTLEKFFYLSPCESVFEKVTVVNINILFRKELLRLAAGISLYPAIEIYFHYYFTSILGVYYIDYLYKTHLGIMF